MGFKNIYLGGPINGCSDSEVNDWRSWVKDQLPGLASRIGCGALIPVDPMKRDYRGKEAEDYREIVDLDKRDIRGCDAVVVMYTKPSVGTAMEIFFAWQLGIPVVLIDESSKPLSPWLRYHSTAIVARDGLMAKLADVI